MGGETANGNGGGNGNGYRSGIDLAIRAIRDLGFPIVVALFLLFRLDPTIRSLADAINDMRSVVALLSDRIDHASH